MRWLLRHPRFHLHFTPTSSSWLNVVERWFAELTTKKIKRGAHTSVQSLERDIRDWITHWNQDPKPYVWVKTADQILAALARYCERVSAGAVKPAKISCQAPDICDGSVTQETRGRGKSPVRPPFALV